MSDDKKEDKKEDKKPDHGKGGGDHHSGGGGGGMGKLWVILILALVAVYSGLLTALGDQIRLFFQSAMNGVSSIFQMLQFNAKPIMALLAVFAIYKLTKK